MEEILNTLNDEHYGKEIQYYVFVNSVHGPEAVSVRVSQLFNQESWKKYISLLYRIQLMGVKVDPPVYKAFWRDFLVQEKLDLEAFTKSVKGGSLLNYDAYLKRLLILVTGKEDLVYGLERDEAGMAAVVDVCRTPLFGNSKQLSDIIDTIRCYRNGNAHHPVMLTEHKEIPESQKLLMDLGRGNQNDVVVLYGVVRLMLVGLLLIIKQNYQVLTQAVPALKEGTAPAAAFDERQFLQKYFEHIEQDTRIALEANAIQMLSKATESGYLDPHLRFKYSKHAGIIQDADTVLPGGNESTAQYLVLTQFYAQNSYETNVVLGMPGAGKSTAFKLIINDIVKQYRQNQDEEEGVWFIPVYIALKDLNPSVEDPVGKALVESVVGFLGMETEQYKDAAVKYVKAMMEEGRAVLFFDGLNEIPPQGREGVVRSLVDMLNGLQDSEEGKQSSRVFISGREYEYDRNQYAKSLETLSGAVGVWHLEEFSFDQIEGYLTESAQTAIKERKLEALFSSPLNIKLLLDFIDEQPDEIPHNRGEILEEYFKKVFTRENINQYFAFKLLKYLSGKLLLGSVTKICLQNSDPNLPKDLIDKLASLHIIHLIPGNDSHPEEALFFIDTYREFFRARYVVDSIRNDYALSLSSVFFEGKRVVDPSSNDDYETLKLVFEIGSSQIAPANAKQLTLSARLALDFIHLADTDSSASQGVFDGQYNPGLQFPDSLVMLCKFVANVETSMEPAAHNARDIASMFVLNHLKLFRIQHPTPLALKKRSPEITYLSSVVEAAAYISDTAILDELFSPYWLFTFGALAPEDFDLDFEVKKLSYLFIKTFVMHCGNYCELYDRLHAIHVLYIKKHKTSIADSIDAIVNQYVLYCIPGSAQKILLNHLLNKSIEWKQEDSQLQADINSLLCFIADGVRFSEHFDLQNKTKLHARELGSLLQNYTDVLIQKTVFTREFFSIIDNDTNKAFVIRYYLFRLGLTPIIRRFLFDEEFIDDPSLPDDARKTITDLIPLKQIPQAYALKLYDKDIYNLLMATNGGPLTDSSLNYHVLDYSESQLRVVIDDVREPSLVHKMCMIRSDSFEVTEDVYMDSLRLFCEVSSSTETPVLLPIIGHIHADGADPIPYSSASPDTVLKFYIYGENAAAVAALSRMQQQVSIGGVPCKLYLPELGHNPNLQLRRFRVLTLNPVHSFSMRYSGELAFEEAIDSSPSSLYSNCIPEHFSDIVNSESVKTPGLSYSALGRDASSYWIVTEKVVTSTAVLADISLRNHKNRLLSVTSVNPFNRPYLELRLSPDQRVFMPGYGMISCLTPDGLSISLKYCHVLPSYDYKEVVLRILDDRAVESARTGFNGFSFRYGSVSLSLLDYEVIRPDKKHSIWTLHASDGLNDALEDGMITLAQDKKKSLKEISVSGETRANFSDIEVSYLNYSQISGDLFLAAPLPPGTIGAGAGNINLLKGLYLFKNAFQAPYSSLRIQIDKSSDTSIAWSAHFRVRFITSDIPFSGLFRIGEHFVNYVKLEDDNVFFIWCDSNEDETLSLDTVKRVLDDSSTLEVVSSSGTSEVYDMSAGEVELLSEDKYGIIIHSVCSPLLDHDLSMLKQGGTYHLQTASPVSNRILYPSVFTPLFFKKSVPYVKHPEKEGVIIISKPISDFEVDHATLEHQYEWTAQLVGTLGNCHLEIALTDKKGRIPRIPEKGTAQFSLKNKHVTCWYKSLYHLIDATKPERYHAEICDLLMEEIRQVFRGDEEAVIDFFVAKSRASDLVFDKELLSKIVDKSPAYRFNVCRVLSVASGILAYSPLKEKNILSSDSDSKNHDGRSYQWGDLVLIEKDKRTSWIDPSRLPRYAALGFKEGYILSIQDVNRYKDKKQAMICCPEDGVNYEYFYYPHLELKELSVGRHVQFYATVNYSNTRKRSAEYVYALNQWEDTIVGLLTDRTDSNELSLLVFTLPNGKTIRVSVVRKKTHSYDSMELGKEYRLIKGPKNYYYLAF